MIPDPKLDLGDPPIIEIRSIEAARDLARRELLRKPDYIKVWFIHRADQDLAAEEAIVRAAGDEAHRAGIALAVHATELNVAKAALRAGADYLVHSVQDVDVDDEFIALAKTNHALYCPTLFVLPAINTHCRIRGVRLPLIAPRRSTNRRSVGRSRANTGGRNSRGRGATYSGAWLDRRVRCDAAQSQHSRPRRHPDRHGNRRRNIGTLHGPSVFREMALMQQAGMTPLEVLRSATVNGAKAMRRDAELGTITPGQLADFVLLDADPDSERRQHESRLPGRQGWNRLRSRRADTFDSVTSIATGIMAIIRL
jgi:hypothetical protein